MLEVLIGISLIACLALGRLAVIAMPELVPRPRLPSLIPRLAELPYQWRQIAREVFSLVHFAVILLTAFVVFWRPSHGIMRRYVAA